jgi:hypothetical protein
MLITHFEWFFEKFNFLFYRGERFAFGHHYLRPHETFHEPSRRFYPNEIHRVPYFETIPLRLLVGRCWVLDAKNYFHGRPVGCVEEHCYVCEFRVDKKARAFTRVSKMRFPVNTRRYAFEPFAQKLVLAREVAPHEIPPELQPKNRTSNAQGNNGGGGSGSSAAKNASVAANGKSKQSRNRGAAKSNGNGGKNENGKDKRRRSIASASGDTEKHGEVSSIGLFVFFRAENSSVLHYCRLPHGGNIDYRLDNGKKKTLELGRHLGIIA